MQKLTTIQAAKVMAAANGVLAELVRTGQVANNREAKMTAYEAIFGMMATAK